jgi:hypothetical protein
MLTITAEDLRRRSVDGDLGMPIICSAVVDQATATLPNVITVPRGQVFLMTHMHLQAEPQTYGLTTPTAWLSPSLSSYGFQISNEAGTGIWAIGFASFIRQPNDYAGSATPTALSAPHGNVVTWKPKYAIPIPGGFRIEASTTVGDFGNRAIVHGFLVDEGTARTLGYNIGTTLAGSRHHITTTRGNSSATTIITGRPGKCIRLLDMHIRLQPIANGTNVLQLNQVDGKVLFRFRNSNFVDMVEHAFAPDEIFLAPGQGLQNVITTADTCSITLQYEFVDQDEVPKNCWWSFLDPVRPTPATTGSALASGRQSSTAFTLFYPRNETTKTTPGVGNQHLVRGVQIGVQKGNGRFTNSVVVAESTSFCVSHGAAAGVIGATGITTGQTNAQITPTFIAGHHDQNVAFVDDAMNVPCKPDDGQLWFDSLNLSNNNAVLSVLTTPTAVDADIAGWSATIWGRTIDKKWRASTNRGN